MLASVAGRMQLLFTRVEIASVFYYPWAWGNIPVNIDFFFLLDDFRIPLQLCCSHVLTHFVPKILLIYIAIESK